MRLAQVLTVPNNDVTVSNNLTVDGTTTLEGAVTAPRRINCKRHNKPNSRKYKPSDNLTIAKILTVEGETQFENINICNLIQATESNSDLELDALGTGKVTVPDADLEVGGDITTVGTAPICKRKCKWYCYNTVYDYWHCPQ